MAKKAPAAPRNPMPSSTAAMSGARIREALRATWLSATALPRRFGSTSSIMYACRDGPRNEKATPMRKEPAAR